MLGTLAGLLCFGGMTRTEGSIPAVANEMDVKKNLENAFNNFDPIISKGTDSLESHQKFLHNVFNYGKLFIQKRYSWTGI